jgi:membrane-bound metal-dependent hydrolase YbcI (DUF457 family)
MMGRTHVLSGAVAWLAAAPALAQANWFGAQHWLGLGPATTHLSTAQMAAGTVIAAGAGLLPDIDHPDGRIAHSLGPVTHTLCRVIEKISGGHRHGTHSLLFTVVMGAGMGLLAAHTAYAWWVALFVLAGFGIRGLGIDFKRHEPWSSIADNVVAGVLVLLMHGIDMRFAAFAVAIGCLAHLIGDCLTPRGCPLFWPIPMRFELPVIHRTNDTAENKIVVPLLAVATVILGVWTVAHGIMSHTLLTATTG